LVLPLVHHLEKLGYVVLEPLGPLLVTFGQGLK
jgi:hypothetical protein